MEIEKINGKTKDHLVELLNKLLRTEDTLTFNYPKVVDMLVKNEHIHDDQLIKRLDNLEKESLFHFDVANKLIDELGGEARWHIGSINEFENIEEMLFYMKSEEVNAIYLYKEVKKVAERNELGEIARLSDQHVSDEERHIDVLENLIDRLRKLKNE